MVSGPRCPALGASAHHGGDRYALVVGQVRRGEHGLALGLEEGEEVVPGFLPGLLVFHVDEVAGVADGAKLAIADQLLEQTRFGRGGVDVQLAVEEQQRDVDGREVLHVAFRAELEHLADVEVHLLVFVLVEAADVAEVVALEQLRQVAADGVVD